MLWACVLLPSLALDTAHRSRAPSARPFALVTGRAQQRRLIAVDARARATGLEPGQRLTEAEAICRDLATAEHDPEQVRASLNLIAAWAYRYSAEVRLDPPRAVMLEAEHSLGLFGPWPHFEASLRGDLDALGFHHRIALAPTPRAARVLSGTRDVAVVVSESDLTRALAGIPVTRANLPEAAAEALTGMGIRTLGAVLALPRAALQRRFGKGLIEALDLLLGQRPDTLTAYQPPDRFDARIDFGCEINHHQGLLFPLRRMLGDLAAHLAARDGGVERFVIRCVHMDAAPSDLRIGLLSPERDAQALFDVAKLRLEQLRLPAPVLELEIHADRLPPFIPESVDLLDARTANTLPWPQLIERLRARLGEEAVYGLRADPDPRPECAWMRAVDPSPTSLTPPATWPRRPTWLLSRPILLRGPAPRVLAGPERLETGWWDGDEVRRDYYVLELADGQRAWAFCAPGEHGPFMLHGWFA
jgi:protein ImuB